LILAARYENGFARRDRVPRENNAENSQNTAQQVALTRTDEEAKQNRRKRIFAQVERKITRQNTRIDMKAMAD
jgi:hypothetical protein